MTKIKKLKAPKSNKPRTKRASFDGTPRPKNSDRVIAKATRALEGIDSTKLNRALRSSNRIFENAIGATKMFGLDGNVVAIFESLCGQINPMPELLASNSSVTKAIASKEIERFVGLLTSTTEFDVGIISFDLTSTNLNALEVRLEGDRVNLTRFLSQVSGGNYYAKIVLRNTSPGSKRISIGAVAVVFGPNMRTKIETLVVDLKSRSQNRVAQGAKPVWLADDPKALARLVFDTAQVPSFKPRSPTDNAAKRSRKRRRAAKKKAALDLQLLCLMSLLDRTQMIVAGGSGKDIKTAVFQAANDELRLRHGGKPPIHPDSIPYFWVNLAREIGRTKLHLPLVTQRCIAASRRSRAAV